MTTSKLTKAEVARRCGVSKPTVSQWTNGSTQNLKSQHLFALADATGFSARWLGTGQGPRLAERVISEDERLLLERYRKLDDDNKNNTLVWLDVLISKKGGPPPSSGKPSRLDHLAAVEGSG
jgi:transcriptional regulator with XRE-family HTH domain